MNISRKHRKFLRLKDAWKYQADFYTGKLGFHFDDAVDSVRDEFQRYGRRYKNDLKCIRELNKRGNTD